MKPSHPLDAVLFDLDGTLVDTAPDFAAVLNTLCKRHGKTVVDFADIRSTVSHGARALLNLAFGINESDEKYEQLLQELLSLYSQHLAVESTLFPGIEDLLNWLDSQSLPWGVVTNKPRAYAEPILAALNLSERCHTLVCPDDVTHTKPNAEPMLLACKQLACNPINTLYIGDHRRDIEAGRNASMRTIAANYGYIDPSDPAIDWQADFYVDHAKEITSTLIDHFS